MFNPITQTFYDIVLHIQYSWWNKYMMKIYIMNIIVECLMIKLLNNFSSLDYTLTCKVDFLKRKDNYCQTMDTK